MKSYLKFLSRNKLYTAIEAVGLAMSLAFVIIIGSYVVQQFEVKYENPAWRDIYTFAMVEDGHPDQLGLTYTFTDAIKAAAPEVEMAGRLSPVEMLMTPKEGTQQAKVVTADRNFFELFPNLTFVEGGSTSTSNIRTAIPALAVPHRKSTFLISTTTSCRRTGKRLIHLRHATMSRSAARTSWCSRAKM